jgi:hypothetical protein
MREARTGYRQGFGNYISSQIVPTRETMDFLTQTFGAVAAVDRPWGNVHGGLNYNWFHDRVGLLQWNNPIRGSDAPYVNSLGGPALGTIVLPPDNSATTGSFGGMLTLAKRTRILADVALGNWKQKAPFYPYTFNTAVTTPQGRPANSTGILPAQSLNGKVDTTTLTFSFTTRPADPLAFNLRHQND